MVKGETVQTQVFYKGASEEFLVFIDDVEDYKKWQGDKSVPMAQFVSSFQVFITNKQGHQGKLDAASKQTLENEFETSNEDEVIKKILEKGTIQEQKFPDRQGHKNDSQGGANITR